MGWLRCCVSMRPSLWRCRCTVLAVVSTAMLVSWLEVTGSVERVPVGDVYRISVSAYLLVDPTSGSVQGLSLVSTKLDCSTAASVEADGLVVPNMATDPL